MDLCELLRRSIQESGLTHSQLSVMTGVSPPRLGDSWKRAGLEPDDGGQAIQGVGAVRRDDSP